MQINNNEDVIKYINSLDGYDGYVQFSHRAIESKDIYDNEKINVEPENGFILEAHFCNKEKSISVRGINGIWYISKSSIINLDENDIKIYKSIHVDGFNKNIKMAQIWTKENDEMCENFEVNKLQKVVFAGFTNDEEKKR